MQNNIVYTIHDKNHELIGVTDSKVAAFSFLVRQGWIDAYTYCDGLLLAEICEKQGVTKENFLDWAVFKLENTDFWENSGFYIHREGLYTEKMI